MSDSILYIHFDLDWWKHSIPINQSIITEQSIQKIISNLSEVLFEWKIKFNIFIEPEIEWWLVKNIVISAFIWLSSYTFTARSDWLLKWLTWKNISEYSQNFWEALKDSTEKFLSKNSQDLVESWLCIDKFYASYEAKNIFYKTAIANNDVKWLWFCKEHNFPIQRGLFLYKTIELKKEKKWDKFIDKYHDLIVVSSINSEKEKKLKWNVKDKTTEEKFWVDILDDDFYKIYFSNTLMIKEFKVKVRYNISIDNFWEETISNQSIIVVYEYNNNYKLMTLPNDFKIETSPYKLPENYKEITTQTNLIM